MQGRAKRRLETFSYLPPMDAGRVRQQVRYMVRQGWAPIIEHADPASAHDDYWLKWKVAMVGETDADVVMKEAWACYRAHPRHHVRIVGYDLKRATRGAMVLAYRG